MQSRNLRKFSERVNSNALFHFLLNLQICGIRPSDRKIAVGKPQDAHLHFDSDSHQQSLCVVLVFGQDERCDWLEDCLSGVPVVRRGTLWGGVEASSLSIWPLRFLW